MDWLVTGLLVILIIYLVYPDPPMEIINENDKKGEIRWL